MKEKSSYSVNLPQTAFPMKANSAVRELEIQKLWDEKEVYKRNLEARKDAPKYVLHDGPPYLSSSKIHIGTALDNPDTDGDGLTDAFEVGRGSDPLVRDTLPDGAPVVPDAPGSSGGCEAAGVDSTSLGSWTLALLLVLGLAMPRVLLRPCETR